MSSQRDTDRTFSLSPIGFIRTPFKDKSQAPRQPRAEASVAEGIIELFPGHNFEQALEDLDGFEKIWVISWFDRNSNWKPKVLPPRGTKIKRGVFATRAPHRPNPIGLSLAHLLEIKGRTVRIRETDLLDGTPILDLKPYLPFAEAFPHAKAGWLDAEEPERAVGFAKIEWSLEALIQADWLASEYGIALKRTVERVLQLHAAPHPYRRISKTEKGFMRLAVKSWRVEFLAREDGVRVERLLSGYAAKALRKSDGKPIHDEAAHRDFHIRFPGCAVS